MPTDTQSEELQSQVDTTKAVSPGAWLRTSVSLTLERWVLVAASAAALVLVLLALD
jgi:hypothetical protein